ncbi:HEAT repeat domain-containing protein [Candidatus Solincola tengchongensis]|uniref:HEAT repeat domain-containing protein n=1 Tax=Candidatus Solincola tengchongensis TaxID=2900693 RepID=UPI00257E3FBB|nr:HEAT repeat domain-containing protein [Candidatus Solincola tengchongensis]
MADDLRPGEETPKAREAGEELARRAVELLIALNAAMINIHMYPPTSDMISASVETAYARLEPLLEATGTLTLGEADNLLLVNGERLHDRDQVRPPVLSFLEGLRRRDVYSITFERGMDQQEFLAFLYIMARDPEELRRSGGLAEEVSRQGCAHIQVNERRFVSVTDEEVITAEARERAEEVRAEEEELLRLEEKLKDERFVAYVTGARSRREVGEETIRDVVSNPPRLGMLLRQAVREIVVEKENPEEALEEVVAGLERAAVLLEEVPDPELRHMDGEEVARAAAFLESSELKDFLLLDKPPSLEGLTPRKKILEGLRENKTLDLLESTIREHEYLHRLSEDQEVPFSPEQELRRRELSTLIDEIYQASVGKPWESKVSDRIFQADMWKKIAEGKGERGDAGASTLVYQISSFLVNEGFTLDIDELSRTLTIDENIPRLLQKLYRARKPETVIKLVESLLDNLEDMSPEIRLKTAETLRNIPDALEMSRRLQEFPVAYEMKDRLLDRLERERELTEIYTTLAGCLAALAQTFILSKDYDAALEIIDTFWRHYGEDGGRKPEQRKVALDAVVTVASQQVLDNLAEVLKEGDIQTITEVAELLIKFEDRSVQPLIQVLKDSEDLLVKRVTFEALENIGKDAILSLINDLEKYNPWHMYRNIISILAEISNRSIIQSLARFIKHQNPEVRRETVKAISRIRTPETTSLLVEAVDDRDEQVQREACLGLGRMRDVSTVPVLVEVVRPPRSFRREKRRTGPVKAAALWALGEIGDRSAIPYCRHLLRRGSRLPFRLGRNDQVRAAAALALGAIGGEECRSILQAYAADRSEEVRRAVAEALRLMQRRKAAS